jgi:hypothetical protein
MNASGSVAPEYAGALAGAGGADAQPNAGALARAAEVAAQPNPEAGDCRAVSCGPGHGRIGSNGHPNGCTGHALAGTKSQKLAI